MGKNKYTKAKQNNKWQTATCCTSDKGKILPTKYSYIKQKNKTMAHPIIKNQARDMNKYFKEK